MSPPGAATSQERLASLSLFYPMYNEEGNIELAAQRALEILPGVAEEFEIILVDDGSRDATGAIADRLAAGDPRIRAIHHPTNLGYGAALTSGIRASRFEWIFYTDGDNQFDLREIDLLLPLRHGHEIVSGFRIDRRDPVNRKLNAWLFNSLVRLLFGFRLRDVDCAFKLYRASIFEGMDLVSRGALIDVEIIARARKRGARVVEIGVHHFPRTVGSQTGAKLSVILRAFRELLRLWGELR
ncbi:MAG: glycosyltransferase family 2 protein [Candidatus Eisenbacteria bacterium]|nr:glycosyltransferase family 2 protein [Candidatus Eisenbacteria bacterium]